MITQVAIENFKGIGERVVVPIKPITLLFGKNSAGKSTILHALLYAQEILQNHNCDPDRVALGGSSVDLGGFKSLVHGHCCEDEIRLRFDLDLSREKWDKTCLVDEFLKDRADLSDRGLDVSTGWVELHVGLEDQARPSRGQPPGERQETEEAFIPVVRRLDIGLDGLWFARLARWSSRDDTADYLSHRLVLNEIHPVLALPGEEDSPRTGNVYGMFGRSFQTGLYEFYFDDECCVLGGDDTDAWMVTEHFGIPFENAKVVTVLDRGEFVEESLRCALTGNGLVVELGVRSQEGNDEENELAVHRIFIPSENKTPAELFMDQVQSVDECPVLENIRDGLPDWSLPFETGWPVRVSASATGSGSGSAADDEPEPTEHEPLQASRFLEQLLRRLVMGPLDHLRKELDAIRYLGPLRAIPPRNHKPPLSWEPGRWADGLAAWDMLLTNLDLTEKASQCLHQCLQIGHTIRREEIIPLECGGTVMAALKLLANQYEERDDTFVRNMILNPLEALPTENRLWVHDELMDLDVSPSDVGVGVSQVVPVVVGALDVGTYEHPCHIFAVEQPELHVHPAVQVALGDVFIQAAKGLKEVTKDHKRPRNPIILIETHSEHLLLRLLRRVREQKDGSEPMPSIAFGPGDLSVVYVRATEEGVELTPLPVTDEGDFSRSWPEGFFDERDSELF